MKVHHALSGPEDRARLGHEAMMLDAVRGPYVPDVLEVSLYREQPYLAMTIAGDRSLATCLRDEGALPRDLAREVLLRAARALQAVHDAGLLHMDLTPANIVLDGAGDVRIVDFGAAQMTEGSPLSGPGSYDGTAGYVAPERCLGARPDARMDVFSLAAVAYRMLLGIRPYADPRSLRSGSGTSPKRLQPPLLIRADIGSAVSDLLLGGLSFDPDDRPGSAGEFARALAAGLPEA